MSNLINSQSVEMAGQVIPCYRQTITGHLHRRIRSQTIAIVRILIAQGDLIDPLTPKITEAMIHITLMPIIRYTVTKTLNQPYGLVHSSKINNTAVTCQPAAIEVGLHFFTGNTCKMKGHLVIFTHGSFPRISSSGLLV